MAIKWCVWLYIVKITVIIEGVVRSRMANCALESFETHSHAQAVNYIFIGLSVDIILISIHSYDSIYVCMLCYSMIK